jgi:hypothetical protein
MPFISLQSVAGASVLFGEIPEQPTNIVATAVDATHVGLTWTVNSENEQQIVLERGDAVGVVWAVLATLAPGTQDYQDDTVEASNTYHYRVKASNGWGASEYSQSAGVLTPADSSVPDDPGTLSAAAATASRIDLTIDNGGALETDFVRVERSPDGTTGWVEIAVIAGDSTSHADIGLAEATQYYYRVRVSNTFGASGYSNTANATTNTISTPPAAPSSPTATAASSTTITAGWADNSNNEQGFKVWRSTSAGGVYTQVATVGPGVTSVGVGGLTASTTYYFKIQSYNAFGDSAFTSVASATTPAPPVDPPPAPGVPSGLSNTVVGSDLQLTWVNNSADADAIYVDASEDGFSYATVGFAPGDATSYTDIQVDDNASRRYKLRTFSATGGVSVSSNPSLPATVTGSGTAPVPSNLVGYGYDDDSVFLHWDGGNLTGYESGWEIQRSASGAGSFSTVGTAAAYVNEYRATGLVAGTTYDWRVRGKSGTDLSTFSNTASAASLSSGQVFTVTGRNPKLSWDPYRKAKWVTAQADYDAAPSAPANRWGKLYKKLRDGAVALYPSPAYNRALMYTITGTAQYAIDCYTQFNTTYMGEAVTVIADAGNSTSQLRFASSVATNPLGWMIFANTGPNKDPDVNGGYRVLTWNNTTKTATVTPAFPNVPQAGESYNILRFPPNDVREQFASWVCAVDQIWQAMDSNQRDKLETWLNNVGFFALGLNQAQYVGGLNVSDVDWPNGAYWGLACLQELALDLGWGINDWLSRTASNSPYVPVGGYDATGQDRATLRNLIGAYGNDGRSGYWMESSNYDINTVPLALRGWHCLYHATGTDHYPEFIRALHAVSYQFARSQYPGLAYQGKWGDNDAAHGGIWQPNFLTGFWSLAGSFSGRTGLAPILADLAYQMTFVSGSYNPYGAAYLWMDPTLTGDHTTLDRTADSGLNAIREQFHYAPYGNTYPTVYSVYGAHGTQFHHQVNWVRNFLLYRNGERVIRNPVGYGLPYTCSDQWVQGFLWAGMSGTPFKEAGPVLMSAITGGHYGKFHCHGERYGVYYAPPPTACHEITNSLIYLKSTGNTHDIIVDYWRATLSSPRKLIKYENYRSGKTYATSTVSASPAPTSTGFSWTGTAGTVSYAGCTITFTSGNLSGGSLYFDKTYGLVASSTGQSLTVAPGVLPAAPDVGSTFILKKDNDFADIFKAPGLATVLYQVFANPTLGSGFSSWTTPGGQTQRITHLLPSSGLQRSAALTQSLYPGGTASTETTTAYTIQLHQGWPTVSNPQFYDYLNVHDVTSAGSGVTITSTVVQSSGTEARGCLIRRTGENDTLVLFSAREAPIHFTGFTVSWTSVSATTRVILCDLSRHKSWTRALDGGGSSAISFNTASLADFTISGAGAHTLVIA